MEAYAKALQQILGVGVDVQLTGLGLGNIQSRDLRNILVLALSFFLLQLERDATDRTTLDPLHQMGGVASDLSHEGRQRQ